MRKCRVCGTVFYTQELIIRVKERRRMTALEYLRKVNKVSKKELSEHLGINQRTYENKEQGETEFTFSEAYKVAKFFGVSMENLYKLLTTTVEE